MWEDSEDLGLVVVFSLGSGASCPSVKLLHFIGFGCFIALGSVVTLQWVRTDH